MGVCIPTASQRGTAGDSMNKPTPEEEKKTGPSSQVETAEKKEKEFPKDMMAEKEGKQEKKNLLDSVVMREGKSLNKGALVDVLFLCDCTGSMSCFVDAAKAAIRKIQNDIKEKCANASLFVGFVGYRDHSETPILDVINLSDKVEDTYKFIRGLRVYGGSDIPEAVADALDVAANKTTWRLDALKILIHVLDAPPHGREYYTGHDDYPRGCPCGLKCPALLQQLDNMSIDYIFCTFGTLLKKTVSLFRKNHNLSFRPASRPLWSVRTPPSDRSVDREDYIINTR